MNTTLLKSAMALAAVAFAGHAAAQVTFFEHDDFRGRAFTTQDRIDNFNQIGFNDRASSVVVQGGPWEVCDDANFRGHCLILRPGSYPSLGSMNMNDRLSSARAIDRRGRYEDSRYAPPPAPAYDWHRRPRERLYEVPVRAVHAVYAAQQQHCWVEREQVERRDPNVGGAIVGGILGGILGHQVGSGTGRDVATVGGAVIGGAVGANVGGTVATTRDVQHCSNEPPRGRPDYWDVSYDFRGVEHHLQATSPPGRTVTVNEAGEPRL